MNTIKIYGNSKTCPNCQLMKSYLDTLGEEYTFYDLAEEDKDLRQEYKRQLFSLFHKHEDKYIPVVIIDNNDKIVGYGAEQIDKVNEYLLKRI